MISSNALTECFEYHHNSFDKKFILINYSISKEKNCHFKFHLEDLILFIFKGTVYLMYFLLYLYNEVFVNTCINSIDIATKSPSFSVMKVYL